jgi:hypothetical protein
MNTETDLFQSMILSIRLLPGHCFNFRDIIDAFSKYVSPKQRLNMDEPGATARPFKVKKRKMVPLTSCQTDAHFQPAGDLFMSMQWQLRRLA